MLRRYLAEHVVVNTDAVDRFATSMSRGLSSPEARAWVYKRARTLFLNDERYLTLMGIEEVPQNVPGYVTQAIDRGDDIYQFSTTSPSYTAISQLVDRFDHIKDFFRDIEEASAQAIPQGDAVNEMEVNKIVLAKKWMTKIPRLTVEQAEQAAEEWARLAGAGARNLDKKGVVVLYQWPNGYYAVRFTDKQTCMRDGHDLQNCLRQGTYWETVVSGQQWIVAIRKPNDEAVVGMRWSLPEPMRLLECKGKNNNPVTAQYVPYVTELLTYFKVNGAQNHDLKSAGIYYQDGHFGTFRDLAKHIHVDGVDYYVTEARIEGQVGRSVLTFAIGANEIGSIDFGDATEGQIVQVMNNLPRKYALAARAKASMEERLLYQGPDGSWGTFEDVAEFTRVGNVEYWQGRDITKATIGRYSYRLTINDTKLNGLRFWDAGGGQPQAFDQEEVTEILTNLPTSITAVNENILRALRRSNIFFDEKNGFGSARTVGTQVVAPSEGIGGEFGGVYLVTETKELARLVFANADDENLVSMATVARGIVDEISSAIIGATPKIDFLVEVLNRCGFTAAPDIEDNHILRCGYVPTEKNGYQPIEESGEVVGDVTNDAGETTTVMVSGSRAKGYIFLYRDYSEHGGYEVFRHNRGKLNSLVFYRRGQGSFERTAGNLILRKYPTMEVTGINAHDLGGFQTRYEQVVADPEKLISMIEALGDEVRLDMGQLMATANYQESIHKALRVSPVARLTKAQAARLYNALNPMKRPGGPIKVSHGRGEQVFRSSFGHIYIQMASSLTDFEPVWLKHPTILERYKKVLEAIATKTTKAIEDAGQSKIMLAEGNYEDNRLAQEAFEPVYRLARQKNREVQEAIKRATEQVPPDADASSRFAALNTKRRLFR